MTPRTTTPRTTRPAGGRRAVRLGIVLVAACAHRPVDAAPPLPVVRLVREGCYGGCEPSALELRGDGTVVEERGPARREGAAVRRAGAVAAADVRRLAERLERDGFRALDSAYVQGAPGCGPYAADAPTVTIALRTRRGAHVVRYDHGCASAPRLLLTLEAAVDSVGDPRRWLRSRTAGDR